MGGGEKVSQYVQHNRGKSIILSRRQVISGRISWSYIDNFHIFVQ